MSNPAAVDHRSDKPEGPWLQAGAIAFKCLFAGMLIATGFWLVSNIRQIPPDSRAVVLRFGAFNREQDTGLLLAWPRPFDDVVLMPSRERIIEQRINGLTRVAQQYDTGGYDEIGPDAAAGAGYFLTGDAAIVSFDASVFYQIVDASAYLLEQAHVAPALERLVLSSAVGICASRDIDTILVARPELVADGANVNAAEQRERLRAELVRAINIKLEKIAAQGRGLGIHITRIDLSTSLPPSTISAFNDVLSSTQTSDRAVAEAQTDATKTNQAAKQEADNILRVAHATAAEHVASAQSDTSLIVQMTEPAHGAAGSDLIAQLYRERVKSVLKKAGSVIVVDPRDTPHFIFPGLTP